MASNCMCVCASLQIVTLDIRAGALMQVETEPKFEPLCDFSWCSGEITGKLK